MHCGPPNQNSGWAAPGLPCSAPWVLGDAVSFLSGVRGRSPTAVAFCCIECSQNASEVWTQHVRFFGQHCNEWQNESKSMQAQVESGICWQLTPYKHHSRSNWQINFCRVENCGPLNFAALFGWTPRTCLRPALFLEAVCKSDKVRTRDLTVRLTSPILHHWSSCTFQGKAPQRGHIENSKNHKRWHHPQSHRLSVNAYCVVLKHYSV